MPSILLQKGGTQVKEPDAVGVVITKGTVQEAKPGSEKGRFDAAFVDDESITTEKCKVIVTDITERLKAREDVTVLTFGASETGKTYTMHHLYDLILKKLADHIETSQEIFEDVSSKAAIASEITPRSPTSELMSPRSPLSESAREDPFLNMSPVSQQRKSLPSVSPKQSRASSRASKRMSKSPAMLNTIYLTRGSNTPSPTPQKSPRVTLHDLPASPTENRSTTFAPPPTQRPTASGVTTIAHGNGRKGTSQHMHFNGSSSHVKLPSIQNLGKYITGGVSIEFWVKQEKTEKSQCILCIADSERPAPRLMILADTDLDYGHSPGSMIISVLDSDHKTFEACVNVEITDLAWHHIEWCFTNIADHAVSFKFDGEVQPIRIGVGEYPGDFSQWKQQGFIGAELKSGNTLLENHFHGAISELQVIDAPGNLIAYWPLDTMECKEVMGISGTAESVDLEKQEDVFPDTSYCLNGTSSYMNIGQVGELGASLSSFTFQVWVRTTTTQQVMTLIGVTDSTHKHAGFGIDLNSSSFGRMTPCRLNLWVRDNTGKTYSCSTEIPSLFDGDWHCLKWTVSEVHLNKVRLQFDRKSCDLDFLTPKSSKPPFGPFTQWVCLGAHNNRGVIERYFKGCIREAKIWTGRDTMLCAHWEINEGPGARIAVDVTGFGNGGIYFTGKKKVSKWICDKQLVRMQTVMTGVPKKLQISESTLKRFVNNKVQFACVAFGAEPDQSGSYKEVKYDVIHGDFFEEMPTVTTPFSSSYPKEAADSYTWIPEDCFEVIKLDSYKKLFVDMISRLQEDDLKSCNTVIVIRLGDARFVGIDMRGHQQNKGGSAFDPLHLTWTDAVVTLDAHGKRNLALNKTVQSVLNGLLAVGSAPHIVRRCCAMSPAARNRVTECFEGTETSSLVRSAVFGTSNGHQTLFILSTIAKYPSKETLRALISIGNALYDKTAFWAAVLIQKRARGMLDRYKATVLSSQREAARARCRHRRSTRMSFPTETAAKAKRIAILVVPSVLHTGIAVDQAKLAKAVAASHALELTLLDVGFDVHVFRENYITAAGPPEREAVLSYIERLQRREPDALLMLHVYGYGLDGKFPKPVKPTEILARILMYEEKNRDGHIEDEDLARKSMLETCELSRKEAGEAAILRLEAEAKRQKNQKRKSVSTTRSHEVRMKALERSGSRPNSRSEPSPRELARRRSSVRIARRASIKPLQEEEEEEEIDPMWAVPITDPEHEDNDDHMYIVPKDACPMFDATNIWLVEELKNLVLGPTPHLGRHAAVCFDVISLRNEEPSYATFAASSRQSISLKYSGNQEGYLTDLLRQGIAGDANNYPGEDNLSIGVNKLLEQFTSVLKKDNIPFDVDPYGTYIGEIVFATGKAPLVLPGRAK